MSPLTLRHELRDGDLATLSTFTASSATAPLGRRQLEELLLAPGQAARHVLIAEEHGAARGYVHLAVDGPAADTAWIVSGAVDPAHRGRGIGGELLAAALIAAGGAGASTVRLSGRPQGYAVPGVDVERDPATARFLERRGARPEPAALAMHRTLHDLGDPPRDPGRDGADVRILECTPERVPALLAMTQEHLSPEWALTFSRHAADGGCLGLLLLAEDAAGQLLGVAARGVVGRDPTRFGPFGVVPAARGRGVGAALLDASLRRMAADGLAHAWFLWTGPGSAAHRLYFAQGFTTLRTFIPYRFDLEAGPTTTAPQEGHSR